MCKGWGWEWECGCEEMCYLWMTCWDGKQLAYFAYFRRTNIEVDRHVKKFSI